MPTFDVLVAGQVCLDLILSFPARSGSEVWRKINPGQLLEVGPVTISTGGCVPNVGLALHRLGIPVRLVGKVGNDQFGKMILKVIASVDHALAEDVIISETEVSSYTVVLSPQEADRALLYFPGANSAMGFADVSLDLLRNARVFHFGYPPLVRRMFVQDGKELVELFRTAKRAGVTTSLDLALPDPAAESGRADWRKILQVTLPYVDVFMPALEEISVMLGSGESDRVGFASVSAQAATATDLSKTARTLLDWGAAVVGLKVGDRGLFLRSAGRDRLRNMARAQEAQIDDWADRQLWSPCFRPQVFGGTTGAGDATIAGFLAAFVRGETLERAATIACAVGASKVEAPDALSGIQTWEKTLARISMGWERIPLTSPDSDWTRDNITGLWHGPRDRR